MSAQKKFSEYELVGEEYKFLKEQQYNAYLKLLEQLQSLNFELYEMVKYAYEQREKILGNKNTSEDIKESELKILDKETDIKEDHIVKKLSSEEKSLFESYMEEYQQTIKETLPRLNELEKQMMENMREMQGYNKTAENIDNVMKGLHSAHHVQTMNNDMENYWNNINKK